MYFTLSSRIVNYDCNLHLTYWFKKKVKESRMSSYFVGLTLFNWTTLFINCWCIFFSFLHSFIIIQSLIEYSLATLFILTISHFYISWFVDRLWERENRRPLFTREQCGMGVSRGSGCSMYSPFYILFFFFLLFISF